jgi:hypothetical protein
VPGSPQQPQQKWNLERRVALINCLALGIPIQLIKNLPSTSRIPLVLIPFESLTCSWKTKQVWLQSLQAIEHFSLSRLFRQVWLRSLQGLSISLDRRWLEVRQWATTTTAMTNSEWQKRRRTAGTGCWSRASWHDVLNKYLKKKHEYLHFQLFVLVVDFQADAYLFWSRINLPLFILICFLDECINSNTGSIEKMFNPKVYINPLI